MSPETAALVAACVAAAAGLLVMSLLWWRDRRAIHRRLRAAAARLEPSPAVEMRGIQATMAQLERAVDAAITKGGDASASETRLVRALSAIHDGIILFDGDSEIVFQNPSAEAFLHARHSEAIVESTIAVLASAAAAGDPTSRTLDLFGPPRRALVLTAEPLDDGHRSVGALVVVEDVTEHQRVAAVRRDFVANISHELKTPVGGIGVLAETIVGEDDVEIMQRLAQRMHHEAMRASRTIDDLLELSRIESGEAVLGDPVPVHLVMCEAVERASTAAEQRGITLNVTETSPEIEVRGDRRQLVSAVFNLIDNAIKYSASGSTVTVSAFTTDGEVRLSVSDRGIGIPRRDLERIFERFYRVDRGRSRETGGTGLGLAIVRHVAANHGGEVTVNSREGEGTTFTLAFPAGPDHVAVPTREAG